MSSTSRISLAQKSSFFPAISSSTLQRRPFALPIQTKLTIGKPNDQYEQEADRVADSVVNKIQRMETAEEEELQMKPLSTTLLQRQETDAQEEEEIMMKPDLQREAMPEEEEIMMKAEHKATGTVSEDIEATIHRKKGSGSPLPDIFRAKVEQAIGADFSGVRVHTDQEADTLSRSLSARAFTIGNDIFFKQGEYNPTSTEGQKLITHELTHTIQQGASTSLQPWVAQRQLLTYSTLSPTIHRKLDFTNTDWSKVKHAKASEGGGSGVLFVKENENDPPLIVKPNEPATTEALLAANLINFLGKTNEGGVFDISAPKARLARENEPQQIKNAVEPLITGSDSEDKLAKKAKSLVNSLDQGEVMIYEAAQGKEVAAMLDESKHSKKKFFGSGRKQRKSSPLARLLTNKAFARGAGKFTAIDLLTGNGDRFFELFNAENFFVDEGNKMISLIDNVYMTDRFAFVDYDRYQLSAETSYKAWQSYPIVSKFAGNQFKEIAEQVWETMSTSIQTYVRKEDKNVVTKQILPKAEKQFKYEFAEGLKLGKSQLERLVREENTLDSLLAGVPEDKRQQAKESLRKRLLYILYKIEIGY